MNLQQFLNIATAIMFQKNYKGLDYDSTYFFLPRIFCKDGFNISIQINNGNYCSSNNGYRELGSNWETAEWGFTSVHEPMLDETAEQDGNTTENVGSAPIELLQKVIDNHGGIDWEATVSEQAVNRLLNGR